MSTRDYSNIPAAIRDEMIESLRKSYDAAVINAAEHRQNAEDWQAGADRERHYADRDDERARQFKAQLDYFEGTDERYAEAYLDALDDARHAENGSDAATEAYVEVADAEHYVQRADYVAEPCSCPTDEAANDEQAGREIDAAVESTGHLPGYQDGEYVDYAEAEAVREIEEEMALEAAGVESWDQL